ncbi:MAG: hypothetical protein ACK4JF_10705, partial [Methylohalobius sp.]
MHELPDQKTKKLLVGRNMKLRATTAFVLLFALMFSLLLPVNQNQVIAQQNPTQQIPQLTPQQIRQIQARSRTVRLIRRM